MKPFRQCIIFSVLYKMTNTWTHLALSSINFDLEHCLLYHLQQLREKTHSHGTLKWSSQNMINNKLGVGAPHLCEQMAVKMMMAETNIHALRRNEETIRTNTHLRLAGTFDRWHKVALISSASGWANVLAQGKYIKPRLFNRCYSLDKLLSSG